MNKYGLQTFIEENAGKVFGDKYLFGDIFLYTQKYRHTSPHIFEVFFNLPWTVISDCFDSKVISDNIKFHEWLVKTFIPVVEKRVIELKETNCGG